MFKSIGFILNFFVGGFCYYFSSAATESLTWAAAADRCHEIHPTSSLVSIHSQLENDFILAEMGRAGDGANRWTGLHGDRDSWMFQWSDNTAFDWKAGWSWNEPNSMFHQVSGISQLLPHGNNKKKSGKKKFSFSIELGGGGEGGELFLTNLQAPTL